MSSLAQFLDATFPSDDVVDMWTVDCHLACSFDRTEPISFPSFRTRLHDTTTLIKDMTFELRDDEVCMKGKIRETALAASLSSEDGIDNLHGHGQHPSDVESIVSVSRTDNKDLTSRLTHDHSIDGIRGIDTTDDLANRLSTVHMQPDNLSSEQLQVDKSVEELSSASGGDLDDVSDIVDAQSEIYFARNTKKIRGETEKTVWLESKGRSALENPPLMRPEATLALADLFIHRFPQPGKDDGLQIWVLTRNDSRRLNWTRVWAIEEHRHPRLPDHVLSFNASNEPTWVGFNTARRHRVPALFGVHQ